MSSPKKPRLLAEERRRKILELLDAEERVTVADLVMKFGVSAVTARADLDALSQIGALVRSHGGAVGRFDPMQDYPLKFKETLHHAEKVRIGQAAAQMLRSNQTVILDSGSTTEQVARHIKSMKLKSLTVITNALNIAVQLADTPAIALIMVGGILRHVSQSFVGPQAERMLQGLHADHFFLAVDGLDPATGPSTPDILEAQLNSVMLNVAREVTIVADASKFGRKSLSVIAPMERIHRVITDFRVSPEAAEAVRERGTELVVV